MLLMLLFSEYKGMAMLLMRRVGIEDRFEAQYDADYSTGQKLHRNVCMSVCDSM